MNKKRTTNKQRNQKQKCSSVIWSHWEIYREQILQARNGARGVMHGKESAMSRHYSFQTFFYRKLLLTTTKNMKKHISIMVEVKVVSLQYHRAPGFIFYIPQPWEVSGGVNVKPSPVHQLFAMAERWSYYISVWSRRGGKCLSNESLPEEGRVTSKTKLISQL